MEADEPAAVASALFALADRTGLVMTISPEQVFSAHIRAGTRAARAPLTAGR